MSKITINGYVLAGGKSSRMGQDKGLMLLNNQPLVSQIASQLKPLVSQVIVVANNPDYKKIGYNCIADKVKEIGPLGGIYTALKHSEATHNVIVSCDTPFVTTRLFEYVLAKATTHEITVVAVNGFIQPLIGVYKTSCWVRIQQAIEMNQLKLQAVIKQFDLQVLELTDCDWFSEKQLLNLNTPIEYQKAIELWK